MQRLRSPPAPPRDKTSVTRYLSEHVYPKAEEIVFREGSKKMGNQNGLDSFDRLFQEIDQMKAQLQDLHTKSLILRSWELQQAGRTAGQFVPGGGFERNRLIHGGDIKLDLECIKSLRGDRKLACATAGFRVFYGHLPNEVEPHFRNAPDEVVKAFNHRADLIRLDVLKNHPNQKASVKLCDEIITAWLTSPGQGSQLHVIHQKYNRLMEIIPE